MIGIFYSALLIIPFNIFGYSHDFSFKNTNARSETRFDRDSLLSFDVSIMGGTAHKSKDSSRTSVELLDTYNIQDLYQTFLNYKTVPLPKSLDDQQEAIIDNFITLASADTNKKIGKASFKGKFHYTSVELNFIQNFTNGFFAELYIPWIHTSVKEISRTDQSSSTDNALQEFYTNLDTIVKNYKISLGEINHSSIGDVTVLGGWTANNDISDVLDFFDTTIELGLSIPTARQRDITNPFALPHGYNGHVGVIGLALLGWGFYDWLTIQGHCKGHYFLKTNRVEQLQLNTDETGYFKLHTSAVKEALGNIWQTGASLKADHIIRGFSLQCSYSYTVQDATTWQSFDTDNFSDAIINTDARLQKWSQHELSLAAEYDFAQEGQQWNPHIRFFYTQTLTGTRVFLNKSGGCSAGIYIVLNF